MLTNPKRTATQAGTPGAPPHPTPPSKSVRPKRGRPSNPVPPRLPANLFDQLQYPSLDPMLRAQLSNLSDEATKITTAADFIFASVAATAPLSHIESELGLLAGSLDAHLLSDRETVLRYCNALVEGSHVRDKHAQRLLAAVAGGAVRTPAVRAVLDYANTHRCMAEADRRRSEALLRKGIGSADKEGAKVRARLQKLWDAIVGADRAFLPGIEIVLSPDVEDALSAAREILPQLEAERATRKADREDTSAFAQHIAWCKNYIRRKENVVPPASAFTPPPMPTLAPQPAAPPANTTSKVHPTITDAYLAAYPEARHRYAGQITIELLRDTLAWAKSQHPTELRRKQIASLEGRIRACDLDVVEGLDTEPAEHTARHVTQASEAPLPILDFSKLASSVLGSAAFAMPKRADNDRGTPTHWRAL